MTLGLGGCMWSMRQLNLYSPDSPWWAFGGTFASVVVVSLIGERIIRPGRESLSGSNAGTDEVSVETT